MNTRTTALVKSAVNQFQARFRMAPDWASLAPGRANVIGEHTDYNDGYVLPAAIDLKTAVVGSRDPSSREIRVVSAQNPAMAIVSVVNNSPIEPGAPKWSNYVRGVLAGFQRLGIEIPGLLLSIDSDVPLGSGLSSSAALEVATATLLEAVLGHRLDPVEKALLCQQAEHEFARVPCGFMDQFASALGEKDSLLLLDCQSKAFRRIPFDGRSAQLLIVNTNVKHSLCDGEYAKRRATCEEACRALRVSSLREVSMNQLDAGASSIDNVAFRRARHVVTEIARTKIAAALLARSDWPGAGRLMYESHVSLRDDYQVSCPELDTIVDSGRRIGETGGVYGARMTGGGFGGSAILLVNPAHVQSIAERISTEYQAKTGIRADWFVTAPAEGASAELL